MLLFLACTVPAPDLARPASSDPVTTPAASPPPAADPGSEKLYQLLYAGEIGADAAVRGQRTRLVTWLAALEFTPVQLGNLAVLSDAVHAADAVTRAEREALGARELSAYEPIYSAIEARLAQPTPLTEAEGEAFATALTDARKQVYEGGDPRAAHYARVREQLAAVRPFVNSLDATTRARLSESRFLLGRKLGPFVNPGDYADLIGTMWDGGDFGSLRATVRPTTEGHMDLGGLWAVEGLQAGPDRQLEGFQLEALVMMALLDPEFPAAIAIRRGVPPPGERGAEPGQGGP